MDHTFDPDVGHPRRWLILAVQCLCLVLVVASVSSLNNAIPSIALDTGATQTEQLWILDAYALVFAGLLLPAGALGDRYGRKKAVLFGLLIFLLASLWASLVDTPEMLIAARALMGVGAAFIMPATLSIIISVFSLEERPKAIAVWAGFAGAGGAIGPLASGLVLEHYWWGAVFFVNVPIIVGAFIAIAAIVPESRDPEKTPIDGVGAILSIIGLTGIVLGIIEGPESGWTSPITIGAFVVGGLALLAFVLWELGRRHPLLDPRLFLIRPFGLSSLTITVNFLVMFGMFFVLVLYLQFVQGYSALDAAIRLLPFPIVMIAASPRAPVLAERFGQRVSVTLGLVIQAGGFLLAAQLEPDTDYWYIVVSVSLIALGMAILMPPSTNAIVSSLPPAKAGVGSAVNDATREVGGAIGIALLGSLLSTVYRRSLGDITDPLPAEAAEAVEDSIAGATFVAADPRTPEAFAEPLLEAANSAYTDGLSVAFYVAAGLGLATAVVIGVFYPRDSRGRAEDAIEAVRAG